VGVVNIGAVMAEIGTALATMDDMRVYVGAPAKVDAPGTGAVAVVPYPTGIDYDGTYARGMDTLTLEILVVLGRPTDRGTLDKLSAYAAGGGPGSVKTVLESFPWTTLDGVRVADAELDPVSMAGIDYLSLAFRTSVWGPGATF
jgi:hypothetical protein